MSVLGVVGGSGGVGASWFAAVLAAEAGDALLVDLDGCSGGIDVTLGLDTASGARWSQLRVAGGHLDPHELRTGVVRWPGGGVLAADVPALDPAAVTQVLVTAAAGGPVVLDLPRAPGEVLSTALAACELVVVVVRADLPGLVAAHTIAELCSDDDAIGDGTNPDEVLVPALGAVVRGGGLSAERSAELVGVPLLGELPAARAGPQPDPLHPSRAVRRLAAGLWAGADRSGPQLAGWQR